jgi:hypothetical protein
LEDVEVAAASGVVQNAAGIDSCIVSDSVTGAGRRTQRTGRRADAMSPVAHAIMEWLLISHKVLSYNLPPSKIGMCQVKTGIQYRYLDVGS